MIAEPYLAWHAALIAALASLAVVLIAVPGGLRTGRFAPKANFEGRTVRVAGLALAAAFAVGSFAALMRLHGAAPSAAWRATLAATIGFGLFGSIDDRWGDRSAHGFRGHLRAALRGRITTGFWKILGGGLTALLAAWLLRPAGPSWLWILDATVIALTANALNLMDTRPIRSGAAFVVFSLVLVAWAVPAVALVPPVLAWLVWDRRRAVMLGDAGSNVLGAVWAVSLVDIAPTWGAGIALLLLLAFHAWTEGHSLNAAITAHPRLNAVDVWLRGTTRNG